MKDFGNDLIDSGGSIMRSVKNDFFGVNRTNELPAAFYIWFQIYFIQPAHIADYFLQVLLDNGRRFLMAHILTLLAGRFLRRIPPWWAVLSASGDAKILLYVKDYGIRAANSLTW